MRDNILRYFEISIKKPRALNNSHVHVSDADTHNKLDQSVAHTEANSWDDNLSFTKISVI